MTFLHRKFWLIIQQRLLVLCLLFACTYLVAAEAIQDEWDDVARLVVIGDIHGDYDSYFAVLQDAGLINRRGNWIGDDTHLVQLGDVPDRGPDTARIIEHLQKLERQARRRDGMVHVLIGNHEFMNVIGDVRYVHPGEYESLISRNADRFRDAYYQQVVDSLQAQEEPPVIDDTFKENWYEQFPLGYVEHRLAWQVGGDFNNWVSTHNSIIRINDMLFMHGGLGPEMLSMSISDINEKIRREILGDFDIENSLGETESGPLWYRGLAINPEETEAAHLRALLDTYQVDTVVIGHTPELGIITPRFGGHVIITDTGMSAYYGSHQASMLVENGQKFALQENQYIPLPVTEEGIIPYFMAMSELLPDSQLVQAHLEFLLHPPVEEEPGESIAEPVAEFESLIINPEN